jgi:hypothetical protein
MNSTTGSTLASQIPDSLRGYLTLCEEVLALVRRENQALAVASDYQPFEFYQGRKTLLLRLDEALNLLRVWRQAWQRLDPVERARHPEVKSLLQAVQDALVKILVLDRENQQALLRRGLVPAGQMNSFASQPPHYAARLYRRHSS